MAKRQSALGAWFGTAARPLRVHQFLIVLGESDPLVWRRIQVPDSYSFWDLHVAIQDAMGWLDCHLHEFRIPDATGRRIVSIGIPPDDEGPTDRVKEGWRVPLAAHFDRRSVKVPPALYLYDFGDGWQHVVMHEGTWAAEPAGEYPRCLGGARRCPPEDCGGSHGYAKLLAALREPQHPEHDELLEWVGGTFDPDAFDPARVSFSDPQRRWKKAFGSRS
jgi:hypothetical protein